MFIIVSFTEKKNKKKPICENYSNRKNIVIGGWRLGLKLPESNKTPNKINAYKNIKNE